MANYLSSYLAALLNDGNGNQILPLSKDKLIELSNDTGFKEKFDNAQSVHEALGYLVDKVSTNLTAANTYTGEQINLLNSSQTADTGYVLTGITQSNGKLTSYTQEKLDASKVSYAGVGAGAPTTVQGAIENIQTTLANLAGEGDGSVSEQITSAISDLSYSEAAAANKAVVAVTETNGVIAPVQGNIDAQYVNVSNSSLNWDTDSNGTVESDLTVQSAIAYLDSQITALETGAARYAIEKRTQNLDANVKEQYVLRQTVNGTTTDVQVPINIYKDSQLLAAKISTADATYSNGEIHDGSGDSALVLVYSVYDQEDDVWTEEVVPIPVADFFSDLTAGNGLTQSNGVINVVKGANSENFLTVNADSIEITGVKDAIDTAEGNAKDYADGLIEDLNSEVGTEYQASELAYVLTGVSQVEGELSSYYAVALDDAHVKTTFAATNDPVAALVPTGGQNPTSVKGALDLIASSLSALTGTAPIDTIIGDTDNTYVKVSTNKTGSTVELTVDDSALGNVATLHYDSKSIDDGISETFFNTVINNS